MGYYYVQDNQGKVRGFEISGDTPTATEQERIEGLMAQYNTPEVEEPEPRGILELTGRSLGSGAVGSVGSSIEGLGILGEYLTGDEYVSPTIKEFGAQVRDYAQDIGPEEEERNVYTDIMSGVGSMGTYLVPGALATLPLKTAGAATRAAGQLGAATSLAGPAGVSEAYNRARAAGLNESEAVAHSIPGFVGGAIQVAPVAMYLRKIPPEMRGQVLDKARRVLEAGAGEFTAEGLGAVVQNLIEKSYNPERGVWDDTLYQAAIGGSAGALLQLGAIGLTGGRGMPGAGRMERQAEEETARQEELDRDVGAEIAEAQRGLSAREARLAQIDELGEAPEPETPAALPAPEALDPEQFREPAPGEFTENQYSSALRAATEKGTASIRAIQEATGLSRSAARNLQQAMIERGDVDRQGRNITRPRGREYHVEEAEAQEFLDRPFQVYYEGLPFKDRFETREEAQSFIREQGLPKKAEIRDIRTRKPAFAITETVRDDAGQIVRQRPVDSRPTKQEAEELLPFYHGKSPEAARAAMEEQARKKARFEYEQETLAEINKIGRELRQVMDEAGLKDTRLRVQELIKGAENSVVHGEATTEIDQETGNLLHLVRLASHVYDPNLTTDQRIQRMKGTLWHEMFHTMRDMRVLKDNEFDALSEYARKVKVPNRSYSYLDLAERRHRGADVDDSYLIEEAVADLVADYEANPEVFQEAPKGIIRRIIDWFKNIGKRFSNEDARRVLDQIVRGDVGRRPRAPWTERRVYRPDDALSGRARQTVADNRISDQPPSTREEILRGRQAQIRLPNNYYSGLGQAAENARLSKGNPDQWMGYLRSQKGVTQEELDWIGLEDWLKSHEGGVTREDVADFIRANQLQIEEVVQTSDDREHEAYTLPGADNYRELLITLPRRTRDEVSPSEAVYERYRNDWESLVNLRRMAIRDGRPDDVQEYDRRLDRLHNRMVDETIQEMGGLQEPFRTPHWAQENVVAHVRVSDRIDQQQNKILFIEEMQSDWHQIGRRSGYSPRGTLERVTELKNRNREITDDVSEMLHRNNLLGFDSLISARSAIRLENPEQWDFNDPDDLELAREYHNIHQELVRLQDGLPPEAPFKTSWPELAFKSALRLASEEGYDAVGWPADADTVAEIERWPSIYEKDGGFFSTTPTGDTNVTGIVQRYTRDLPRIASKIGKKFGAKPQSVPIEGVVRDPSENGDNFYDDAILNEDEALLYDPVEINTMDIPEPLRVEVSKGQPLFGRLREIRLSDDPAEITVPYQDQSAYGSFVIRGYNEPVLLVRGKNFTDERGRSKGFGLAHAERHLEEIQEYTPFQSIPEALHKAMQRYSRVGEESDIEIRQTSPRSMELIWRKPGMKAPLRFVFDRRRAPNLNNQPYWGLTTVFPDMSLIRGKPKLKGSRGRLSSVWIDREVPEPVLNIARSKADPENWLLWWHGAWSGELGLPSAAVNSDGSPRIYYHATPWGFDSFRVPDKASAPGVFFSTDPNFADEWIANQYELMVVPKEGSKLSQAEVDHRHYLLWQDYLQQGKDERTAFELALDDLEGAGMAESFRGGGRFIPVHLSFRNPFDPDLEEHREILRQDHRVEAGTVTNLDEGVGDPYASNWSQLEQAGVMEVIHENGFDAVLMKEAGAQNVMVFDNRQAKSIFNDFSEDGFDSSRFRMTMAAPPGQRVPPPPRERLAQIEASLRYNNLAPWLSRLYPDWMPGKENVEEFTETALIKLQDQMLPVGKLMDMLRDNDGVITTENDVYMHQTVFSGLVDDALVRSRESLYDPMTQAVKDIGISDQEANSLSSINDAATAIITNYVDPNAAVSELYLYARHAPERNREMRKRNQNLANERQDQAQAGSGMTDQEAAQIMSVLQSKPYFSRLQAMEQAVRQVINDTNRIRVESGLTPDFKAMVDDEGNPVDPYENYVPLRGWVEEHTDPDMDLEAFARAGKGFKIRGKEDRAALGRSSLASHILANSLLQHQEAIIRAEKNKVDQSFLKLLEDNPDMTRDVAEVLHRAPVRYYYDSQSGVVKRGSDRLFKNRDDILVLKQDGQEVAIEIHDPKIANALVKRQVLGNEGAGAVINALGKLTRFFAATRTSWNPEFMVRNFIRDIEIVMANLTEFTAQDIPGLHRQVAKDLPKALGGIAQELRGLDEPPGRRWMFGARWGGGEGEANWREIFREFRQQGGKTAYWGIRDIGDTISTLNKELAQDLSGPPGKSKQAFKTLFKFIEDYNDVVENGIRVSAYRTLRDKFTELASDPSDPKNIARAKKRAAQIAREININFNRGGDWKTPLNALYLFYNAAWQGNMALINPFLRSKAMRKVWASVFVAGATQDMLNSLISGEDEEGKNDYDYLPDWVHEFNMVWMDPLGLSERGYFQVPMAWGLGAVWNAGRASSAMMRGAISPGKAASQIIGVAVNHVDPMSGNNSFMNFVSPTILDPVVDVAMNRDFTGRPITPPDNPFGLNEPASQRHWNNTSPVYTKPAEWISKVSKLAVGDPVENVSVPGPIEISPNHIKYFTEFITGGTGTFVRRVSDLATVRLPEKLEGDLDDFGVHEVPFLRAVYGNITRRQDLEFYFENRDRVLTVMREIDQARETGDSSRMLSAINRWPKEYRIGSMVKNIDRTRQKLNRQKKEIMEDANLSDDQKKEMIDLINERVDDIVGSANRVFGRELD